MIITTNKLLILTKEDTKTNTEVIKEEFNNGANFAKHFSFEIIKTLREVEMCSYIHLDNTLTIIKNRHSVEYLLKEVESNIKKVFI